MSCNFDSIEDFRSRFFTLIVEKFNEFAENFLMGMSVWMSDEDIDVPASCSSSS